MSIHVALHHRTTYRYEKEIERSQHVLRLTPESGADGFTCVVIRKS